MSMHEIVDERQTPKGKSAPNAQRYLRAERAAIAQAIKERLAEGSIKDLGSKGGQRLRVKRSGLSEPTVHEEPGTGRADRVFPGNKEYAPGDRIPRQKQGSAQGSQGSPDGEGEDAFDFALTQEDFLDIVFDGLEIPDMVKKALIGGDIPEFFRAGCVADGAPSQLDTVETMRRARPRRMAFRAPKIRRIREIDEEVAQLEAELERLAPDVVGVVRDKIESLRKEREGLERKIRSVPFLEKQDLRFRHFDARPTPVAQAVMFALMDVSGSMEEWHKEMAKRYFLLLYLFLRRNYDRVEIIFIRHTQEAQEVDEQEFFYGKETGGTVVSTALRLMQDIVNDRYPLSEWNIYGCQASDGDDWMNDIPAMEDELTSVLELCQYYTYVEVRQSNPGFSTLWPSMERFIAEFSNLAIARITDVSDVYPVFRKLFERK